MRNDEIEAMRLVDGSNKAAIQVAGSGRNYGIDCLKSISMLMVVILHVLGFGGWLSEYPATSVMGVVIWLPETFSYCAVDCFAIVTGYVYSSSRFRYSNLAGLWLRALYYSFGITLLWVLLGDRGGVGLKGLVKSLLPVGYESYWFLTAYVGMFLLIPLMNSAIRAISHKRLLVVVASLLLAYSMYPTLLARDVFSTGNGYSVWWLLILYLVGATLRAYERDVSIRGRWIALAYLGLGVVTWLSHPIRSVLEDILPLHVISLVNYTSPSVVGMAVALVLLFARLHVPEWARRSIELITQLSFSVYLIHVHPLMVEPLGAVFARLPLANPVPAPLVVVLAAIAVYVVCLLIDYPREMMFKKLGITRRLREAEEWIEERLRQGKR